MKQRAYKLMKTWCDALFSYQVRTQTPYTDRALLCPACHAVHGRIADLCFPLAVMWDREGDPAYLERADGLIDFSEYNLKTEGGLWYNDVGNRWYATSAFSAMSIGDALFHFGDKLPEPYRSKWERIFFRMINGIMTLDTRETFRPVINYYCGIATVLALAWRLSGDGRYLAKSKKWLGVALAHFDGDGILFGEGYPVLADDGSRTVDMGYNLEESLPLLLRYAELTGEYGDFFRERMRDHLAFLLPDGAIDDSFGTRQNKWTYWGSRTSDGVIAGLALHLDDPTFAAASERVLSLYEKCTHGGLLSLPMAHIAGEPTCLHHTFTHAKALAALAVAKKEPAEGGSLPMDAFRGVKSYQNGRLLLMQSDAFRATVSAMNSCLTYPDRSNAGGSMTLLYHRRFGAILAATTAEYIPSEPANQQYLRHAEDSPCMTAEFTVGGEKSCKDGGVRLRAEGMTVTAQAARWQASYTVEDEEVRFCLRSSGGVYHLPLVVGEKSAALSPDGCTLTVEGGLTVTSSVPLRVNVEERVFHQVGGFVYLPVEIPVEGEVILSLRVASEQ